MSRSASVPLTLDTATIEPPEPASTIARATARIVSQVPVRLVSSTFCQSAGDCSSSSPDAPMPAHATSRSGVPCAATVCSIAARHRVGIADVAIDVAVVDVPHGHGLAGRAHLSTTARPIPDPPPVTTVLMTRLPLVPSSLVPRCDPRSCSPSDAHSGGPISSTRTPSGAVITAIATLLPPGAGISMRRTPSSKPSSASLCKRRVDIAFQRQQEEAERRPDRRPGRAACTSSNSTSSTMPAVGGVGVAEEDRSQPYRCARRTGSASHR